MTKKQTSARSARCSVVATLLAGPAGAFVIPAPPPACTPPAAAAAAAAAWRTQQRRGASTMWCDVGVVPPVFRVASGRPPQDRSQGGLRVKHRYGRSRSSGAPVVVCVGGHPGAVDDTSDGSTNNGRADGSFNTNSALRRTPPSSVSALKKNGAFVFKSMSLVLMGILHWLLKRSAIILAAVLLVGFVRYGSAGTIKMLPFLPPLKQKARTLSDWSSLATVYGVVATFIAAIMIFGMADSAIELAANNRKEDQAREAQFRNEDQAREDRFREEDGQERREERREDKLERQQDRLERKQERQEDKLERQQERQEDKLERQQERQEDKLERQQERREDNLQQQQERREDKLQQQKDRLERQQERLEEVILGLHRERRQGLLFPWVRQTVEDEIEIAAQRLERLQEKIDTLQ